MSATSFLKGVNLSRDSEGNIGEPGLWVWRVGRSSIKLTITLKWSQEAQFRLAVSGGQPEAQGCQSSPHRVGL